jgi:hypothetical protein
MITAADITDSQIAALRREARAAGDYDMANVCTIALGSEETATCADVMAAKRTCA